LIRYSVTSVFTLDGAATFIGVLLSGDIVDGKTAIPNNAVEVSQQPPLPTPCLQAYPRGWCRASQLLS
jgi:hypothetical protein